MQQTYEGALTRLHNLKAQLDAEKQLGPSDPSRTPKSEYIASVENGIQVLLQHKAIHAVDFCCVVVERIDSGEQHVAFSQGRPYPLTQVQQMLRDGVTPAEIGHFCKVHYKDRELPCSRECQVDQATSMALAQFNSV